MRSESCSIALLDTCFHTILPLSPCSSKLFNNFSALEREGVSIKFKTCANTFSRSPGRPQPSQSVPTRTNRSSTSWGHLFYPVEDARCDGRWAVVLGWKRVLKSGDEYLNQLPWNLTLLDPSKSLALSNISGLWNKKIQEHYQSYLGVFRWYAIWSLTCPASSILPNWAATSKKMVPRLKGYEGNSNYVTCVSRFSTANQLFLLLVKPSKFEVCIPSSSLVKEVCAVECRDMSLSLFDNWKGLRSG